MRTVHSALPLRPAGGERAGPAEPDPREVRWGGAVACGFPTSPSHALRRGPLPLPPRGRRGKEGDDGEARKGKGA